MNCLGVAEYDPATAASKTLTPAAAMTAFDTTNLRLTFTALASGNVQVRLKCSYNIGGSSAPATFLLGILDGATVRLRSAPMGGPKTTAVSTSSWDGEVSGVITGLTPGNSFTWDAAYGIETVTSLGMIKYGGPDNTTATDAWGAIQFEIYEA